MLAGFAVSFAGFGSLGLSRMLMPGPWAAVTVLVIVATAMILLVGRYLPFTMWSPIYGFITVYVVLGIAGYVYYGLSTSYLGTFYDTGVSESGLAQGLLGFFVALTSFLAGALVYLLSARRHQRLLTFKAGRQAMRVTGRVIRPQIRRFGAFFFVPLLVPILLYATGRGLGNLWSRSEYLLDQFHFVYVLGSFSSLPVLVIIGYMLPAKKSIGWRIACVALLILHEVLFLSASSRRFAIAPLFFIVGLALGGIRRRTIMLIVGAWMLALPLLSTLPLELRGMPEQGLALLPSNLGEIFAQGVGYIPAADTLLMNVTFSVPLAAYVKDALPIPKDYFLVSINPLPSFVPVPSLPPWAEIGDQLKVSPHQPYSALGELLNQGWGWLILYYAIVGLIAAWADIGARVFEGQCSRWGFLFACGMLDFFSITSTQYQLRSSTRFIYYAILIVVAWRVWCRIRVNLRASVKIVDPPGGIRGGEEVFGVARRNRV